MSGVLTNRGRILLATLIMCGATLFWMAVSPLAHATDETKVCGRVYHCNGPDNYISEAKATNEQANDTCAIMWVKKGENYSPYEEECTSGKTALSCAPLEEFYGHGMAYGEFYYEYYLRLRQANYKNCSI